MLEQRRRKACCFETFPDKLTPIEFHLGAILACVSSPAGGRYKFFDLGRRTGNSISSSWTRGHHALDVHTGMTKVIVAFSSRIFCSILPIREKGGFPYGEGISTKRCTKKSALHASGSILHEM